MALPLGWLKPLLSDLGEGRRSLPPSIMAFNKADQVLDRFFFGNMVLHTFLAHIEVDFAGGAADITKVGVSHFTGTVNDATHDGNLNALEMGGLFFDPIKNDLQIEKGATAAGTGDVFGLGHAVSCCLQDVVGKFEGVPGGCAIADLRGIADAIAQEGANPFGSVKKLFHFRTEKSGFTQMDWVRQVLMVKECGQHPIRARNSGRMRFGDTGDNAREMMPPGDIEEFLERAEWTRLRVDLNGKTGLPCLSKQLLEISLRCG